MRVFFGAIGALLAFLVAVLGVNYIAYGTFAFFAPRYEAVRRDVMINSRAYAEGQTREMYRLKLQYQQAKSDDERATIRALALHEAAAFDRTRLPSDLQSFLAQLGG